MNRLRQIVIRTLAVIGAAAVALQVYLIFAIDCIYHDMASAVSPDGERVAEVRHRKCESDSGPTLELRIVAGKSIVSTDIGPAITNQIGLTWRGKRWLIVSLPPTIDVFDRKLKDVEVEFRVAESD
jgi:hypothetical protein